MASFDHLRKLFEASYSSRNLAGIAPAAFHAHVGSLIGSIDSAGEGYAEPARQRDLSIKFHWGHTHDFGDGHVYEGRMGWRHVDIIARFADEYGLPLDLRGRKVLDIGVWTGGTSLLLVAMGAEVVALEEVAKYSDAVNFLSRSFGIGERLRCMPRSLYEALPMFCDRFDYIIYSGVVYHVSDPLMSMRLAFCALRDDGSAFIETYGYASGESVCRYEGPSVIHGGDRSQLNRGGWNYFIPSPKCLDAWCRDAGFQVVRIGEVDADSRLKGVAQRTAFSDLCRAGLSNAFVR
jgi:SAM-dependent methyltransferase